MGTTRSAYDVPLFSIDVTPGIASTFSEISRVLQEISTKMTAIIDFLANLNRAVKLGRPWRMLDAVMALSALVALSIYCQCVIKSAFFYSAIHVCKKSF